MTQDRSELLAALAELCRKYPHWRFGQLIANVAGWADAGVWDVEDEQLLAAAVSHLGTDVTRTVETPDQCHDEAHVAAVSSLR